MKKSAKRLLWFIACLLGTLQAQRSYAKTDIYRDSIAGPFTGTPSFTVSDPNYALSGAIRKAVRNTVVLRVLDNVYISTSFTYTVSITVVYYTYNAPTTPVTVTTSLTVSYVPGQGAKYRGLAIYQPLSAYSIQVTVNSATGSPPAGSIQLSSEVIVDRVYPFTASTAISPTYTVASNGKQLNMNWIGLPGADEYDVEWTTINDGNKQWAFINAHIANPDTTTGILDTLAIVFRNNSSRLTQNGTSCTISLSTTDSLLLVRVRQVRYTSLGIRQPGNWDYSNTMTGKPFAIIPVTWSEAAQNWQYSAAYAEQGKKKEVISYFDGTLRGRQTVTLDNSDQVAIAQENVYDYFGRPSASILPAPYKDSGTGYLHYIPLFNVAHVNTPYAYQNVLGTTPGTCELNPDTLDKISGASQYYSTSNQFITANLDNRYIPDAVDYPLSVTQYTNDNTGRIKSQGGVGLAFQPGKSGSPQASKTTKYYYGKPQQWELDQLFANDAGYAEHYLKNMVADPNGQVSVSYLNASGKTVATVLSGPSPGNVDTLPSYKRGALTYSKLLKPTDFVYNATALSLSASTTLLEAGTGTDTLKFNMKKMADLYPGGTFSLCSNCYYVLTGQVTDDCGAVVAPIHQSVGSATTNPSDTLTAYNLSVVVPIGHPGEYNVNMTLAYDQNVVQVYADNFVSSSLANTYLTKQFDYIKKRYLDSLDLTGCYNDCHTCEATIGTKSDFVAMLQTQFVALGADTSSLTAHAFSTWAGGLYTQLKSHCDAINRTCAYDSPCAQQQNMMLADVSPGGQYALFADSTGKRLEPGANAIADTLSGNTAANWRIVFPIEPSSNPTWQANQFTLPNGTITSPNDASFTLANLIAYWNPNWANSFLQFHPEYCQLQFCENHQTYIGWDQYVQQDINTADSVPKIPHGSAPALSYSYTNASDWLLAGDPFFQAGGAGHTYQSAMDADLMNFSQNILNIPTDTLPNKGLMQYVDFMLYCLDTTGNMNTYHLPPNSWYCTPNNSCRVADREWQAYRQYYFQAKQKYYNILIADTCGSKCQVGQSIVNPEPGSCPVATDFSVQLNTDTTVTPCGAGYQTVAVVHNGGGIVTPLALTLYYPPNRDTGLPASVSFNTGDSKKIICLPNDIPVSAVRVNAVYCGGLPQYGNDPTWVVHVSDANGGTLRNDCGLATFVQRTTSVILENSSGTPVNAVNPVSVVINFTQQPCSGSSFTTQHIITIQPGQDTASYNYPERLTCPSCHYNYLSLDVLCIHSLTNASNVSSTIANCSDYSYSNPQQPPPGTCPPALIVKQPRFPQVTLTTGGETGYTDSTFVSKIIGQIKQEGADYCAANSDAWIQALQPGFTALGTSPATITSLRNALIAVCSAGVDQAHPMGASSEPSGGAAPDTTFGAAIKRIILSGGTYTTLINPWLIDSPYPYKVYQQSVPITVSNSDSSLCALLNYYTTLAGGSSNLYSYLVTTYGSAMTLTSSDVDSLQKSCGNCRFMLGHDIALPVFLDPKKGVDGCINYTTYSSAKSAMISAFGGTLPTTDPNYPTILANYMNQHFGFSLSYDQYVAYEANHSGSLCNQTPYASTDADPYDCVKNQVQVLVANGIQDWNSYIAAARQAFISNYESTCSMAQENATMASVEQLYHYTLYYYDQADNLVRTVPPEGVNLVASSSFPYIDKARDADTTTVVYNGPAANSNQTAAMDTLSNILSAPHGTVEMWLYNPALAGHYKFGINTPDNAYAFQTGIGGNTLTIDIFPKAGTTEWHYQADISALQPLNPFASVVLKGDALGTGPASPGVYLNGTRLTVTRTSSAPSAVLDSMQMLKHLRLYRHQLSDHSITADAAAVFFAANDPGYSGWYRFNVPAAGSITTVNDTSTREQQYYDIYPAHGLLTTYIYNATNQVTMQRSPDGGVNRYWYDLLSRLSVSQNDKQKTANYSYTLYDTLGRVTEVGQKNQTTVTLTTPGYLTAALLSSFIAAGTNSQITHTYYDTPADTTVGHTTGIASIYTQNNLRKRVAASTYADVQTGPVLRATYYTYDIDGNVSTLWQQLDGLYVPSTNAGLKRIDYEYDLVSGKVNFVRYQTSQPDAFYYAYSYDADNRITAAVAGNRVVMDTVTGSMLPVSIRKLDARYYYYLHGPLRRMELGGDGAAVQGLDYAYTLQGWLKGVNSASGASFYDMGLDSATVAKDAYGYSLGYYTGDYTPIGGTAYKAFSLQYSQTMGDITGQSLYNGNISNTTYAINQLGTPVGYTYAYDQLNRIKRMRQYAGIHGTSWSRANITQNYQENVTYDGNGNILTYGRNGLSPTTAQTIDSLTYHYTLANGKITTNKLNYITDAVSSSGYNLDLRNQTSLTNYRYDAIGNLIYDNYSGITGNGGVNSITWSVYGKPLKIYKAGADSITYTYNTANQRVSKNELGVTSWYVRDAQGNVLALYDNIHGNNNWREQHLYGSSRLGMWMPNMNMVTNNSVAIWDSVGKKQYELDNHLGNVMTTVTDKRLQHSTSGTSIDYYLADVASAQDYYPGGMLMPSRIYTYGSDSSYRYGFNGRENDNTVKGLGNEIDYGNRIYDPRIVRFDSVDPDAYKYPWYSSYQFSGNMPIKHVDIDGREVEDDENMGEVVDADGVPETSHLRDVWSGKEPFPESKPPETPSYLLPPPRLALYSEKLLSLPGNSHKPLEKFVHPSKLTDQDIKEISDRLRMGMHTQQDLLYQAYLRDQHRNSVMGQLLDRAPDSRILTANLLAAGVNKPDNVAAHHIVAGTDQRAQIARDILKREGIDLNEAVNGVFLPLNSKYENRPTSTHSTLHTDVYYRTINERLRNAQPGKVADELKKIGNELSNGTFPY